MVVGVIEGSAPLCHFNKSVSAVDVSYWYIACTRELTVDIGCCNVTCPGFVIVGVVHDI